MAIVQSTIVDQIEITAGDEVQVRLALLIINNGVEVSRKHHRTVLPKFDGGTAVQMAEVNNHLAMMGEQPVSQADIDRIAAYVEFTKSLQAGE